MKIQLGIAVWVYSWVFWSVAFIYVSISLNVRWRFLPLYSFKIVLTVLASWPPHKNFILFIYLF